MFLYTADRGIVADLESYFERVDRVILIDTEDAKFLTDMLCRSDILKITDKKLAIISMAKFLQKNEKHIYRNVSKSEMEILLDVYRTYEASDRLILLTNSCNYGSLWNYVNAGIISTNEMFTSMIG